METSIETPVDYVKLMAEAAAKAVKDERAPSSFISFKSGILTIDDQPIPGNKIKCVVLASLYENDYFPRKFDPTTLVSPDCWALGHNEDDMKPPHGRASPHGVVQPGNRRAAMDRQGVERGRPVSGLDA